MDDGSMMLGSKRLFRSVVAADFWQPAVNGLCVSTDLDDDVLLRDLESKEILLSSSRHGLSSLF